MCHWLKKQALVNGDSLAIVYRNKSFTFSEVYELVQQKQKELLPFVKHNRRIGLIGTNSFALYLTILALWELNREIVFLNYRLTRQELMFQLEESETKIVIGDFSEKNKFPNDIFFSFQEIETTWQQLKTIDYDLKPTDVASIMFTSGTTGKPKGVIQTFSNHKASALATKESLKLTKEDEWLCVTPIIHISGLSIICRSLIIGLTVSLVEKFDTNSITKLLKERPITIASVVSVMLEELITIYPDSLYNPAFRTMLVGGSSIPDTLIKKCVDRGLSITLSFGMTESCSQVFALDSQMVLQKKGSSGLPLKNVSVYIKKKSPEKIGEIWLKGPQIVSSYLKETSNWTADGWFKTGDLGYLDKDGFLFVKSRMKELIISGGENIYPAEIESVLLQHPEVKEIAVIGKEDVKWGQIPVAFVVTDCDIDSLRVFGQSYLAKFKLPKQWITMDELPKTTSGKINKNILMREIKKYV